MSSQCFRHQDYEQTVPIQLIDNESCILLSDIQDTFQCPISILTLADEKLPWVCDSEQKPLTPMRIRAVPNKTIDCDSCDWRAIIQRIDSTTQKTLENTETLIMKTNAILRQTFELQEYRIPRLFVILPDKQSKLPKLNFLQQSYRLFFLCECEHERERHLAFHEGYRIKRASEFIKKYGCHLRNMLTVVKLAVSVSSILLPQLSHLYPHLNIPNLLKNANFYDSFKEQIQEMTNTLDKVMDEDTGEKYADEHLTGSDLREFEDFLEKLDTHHKLGNLYRSSLSDGRIRWVCLHHYRQVYGDKKMQILRREFRALDGDIRFDSALITKKNEKNFNQLLDVISRGLRLYELKLTKCHLNKLSFDNLLTIAGERSQIQYLDLDRISVYKSIGVKKDHLKIIRKLEKAIQSFAHLNITYTVKCPTDRSKFCSIHKDLFDYSIKQTNSRLILNVYSLNDGTKIDLNKFNELDSLYLTKTANQSKIITHFEMSYLSKELTDNLLKNTFLTQLTLRLVEFDEATVNNLRELLLPKTALRTLELDTSNVEQTKLITMLSSVLVDNVNLEVLRIYHFELDDSQLQLIGRMLSQNKHLIELDLSKNKDISNDGAIHLACGLSTNETLRILNLTQTSIGDIDEINLFELFLEHTSLQQLSVSPIDELIFGYINLREFRRSIEHSQTFEILALENFQIKSSNQIYDMNSLAVSHSLVSLSLRHCLLSPEIISNLFHGLISNETLRILCLDKIIDNVDTEVITEFVKMLQSNSSLKKIIYTNNTLMNQGAIGIGQALRINKTLEELDISENEIMYDGAAVIADAVRVNNKLTLLKIEGNHIGYDGVQRFSESLSTNKTLKELYLANQEGISTHYVDCQKVIRELADVNEMVRVYGFDE
jgi:hypothetical protein